MGSRSLGGCHDIQGMYVERNTLVVCNYPCSIACIWEGGDCKAVAISHCVAICDDYAYAIERSIAVLLLIAEIVR